MAQKYRYVDLSVTISEGGKQNRVYELVEPQAAQAWKKEVATGLLGCLAKNEVKYIDLDGPLYGQPPRKLLSPTNVLKINTEDQMGQKLILTFKVLERNKSTPKNPVQARSPDYNHGSTLHLEIDSNLPVSASPVGRRITEFFRPFEGEHLLHYRQEELETLGRALGGIDPVFELQRTYGITANTALAVLDGGTKLEDLVEQLKAKKKK